jgi:hypothetical protein
MQEAEHVRDLTCALNEINSSLSANVHYWLFHGGVVFQHAAYFVNR